MKKYFIESYNNFAKNVLKESYENHAIDLDIAMNEDGEALAGLSPDLELIGIDYAPKDQGYMFFSVTSDEALKILNEVASGKRKMKSLEFIMLDFEEKYNRYRMRVKLIENIDLEQIINEEGEKLDSKIVGVEFRGVDLYSDYTGYMILKLESEAFLDDVVNALKRMKKLELLDFYQDMNVKSGKIFRAKVRIR